MSAAKRSQLDNFARQLWFTYGAGVGIALTWAFGWAAALGWFIGCNALALLMYALMTGRVVVRRADP